MDNNHLKLYISWAIKQAFMLDFELSPLLIHMLLKY